MKIIAEKAALVCSLLLMVAGCMGSPTDRQWFNNREDSIPFSGLVSTPGEMINVEVYRRALDDASDGWDFLVSAQADMEPTYTEPGGRKWYAWHASSKIHFSTKTKVQRWKMISNSQYEARVRAFSWTSGNLATMRGGLMQCLQGNKRLMCGGAPVETGQQAVDECGTGSTEARIYAVD